MERIVAAVDGSVPSRKAVAVAADLAARCDAELILVTVMHEFAPVIDADLDAYARLETFAYPVEIAGSLRDLAATLDRSEIAGAASTS